MKKDDRMEQQKEAAEANIELEKAIHTEQSASQRQNTVNVRAGMKL